jgi:hypothetical protein
MIGPNDEGALYDESIPSVIEPIFWGTSELLQWDAATLLTALEQRGAITSEMRELLLENVFFPQGIYGYFPIITEHGSMVLLDPSDFQTELAVVACNEGYRRVAESCHPDGDIIAIGAVTTGINPLLIKSKPGNGNIDVQLVNSVSSSLLKLLLSRCSIEIRRGMELPDTAGTVFDSRQIFSSSSMIKSLFEIMSLEERIGILPEETVSGDADRSALNLFFPRYNIIDTKK